MLKSRELFAAVCLCAVFGGPSHANPFDQQDWSYTFYEPQAGDNMTITAPAGTGPSENWSFTLYEPQPGDNMTITVPADVALLENWSFTLYEPKAKPFVKLAKGRVKKPSGEQSGSQNRTQ